MPAVVADPSVAGRKVFFIRPHSVIQQNLVASLIGAEFDVGLVQDYTKAEALFRRHPHCIAFLNIDEGWSAEDWDAFIQKMRSDPVLTSVRLGIVTYNESPQLARRYLIDLELPAGFVKLNLGLAASTDIILKVLEANEARGRRQFLRVPCSDDRTTVSFKGAHGKVSGVVRDISISGLSCTLDHDVGLQARTPLAELQLKLQGVALPFSGVLMGSRRDRGGHLVFIIVFQPASANEHKDKIRAYLQITLQRQLEAEVRSL